MYCNILYCTLLYFTVLCCASQLRRKVADDVEALLLLLLQSFDKLFTMKYLRFIMSHRKHKDVSKYL